MIEAEEGAWKHLSASVAFAKTRMLGRSLCTSKVLSVALRLSGKKRTTGVSTLAAQSATAQPAKMHIASFQAKIFAVVFCSLS